MLAWWVVFGCGLPDSSSEPPADPFQSPFEKLSGQELVRQLQDGKTRSRAFYELERRALKTKPYAGKLPYSDEGYESFLEGFDGARLRIVPQAGGAPPLYLVTYSGSGWFFSGIMRYPEDGNYRVPRREELFPPIAEPPPGNVQDSDRKFHLFNGEGKMLELFTDDAFTPETIANVTGDGRLAHIETINCGLEGADSLRIRTLVAQTVEENPRTLLHLMLNWNADDWTHRVRDTDGDGICEIEIGPRTAAGIVPMVVFRWDRQRQTFVSTKLGESDHFRLLPDAQDDPLGVPFAALEKFQKGNLKFSATPGAVSESDALRHLPPTVRPDREENFPCVLPADFWRLTPKAAALAFADANRKEEHRNRFRLALEDRDGAGPPENGTVALTEHTQGCTGARDAAWFLRIDPEVSYIATGRGFGPRARPLDVVLELKRLPYDKARQLGAVLWWLDRIRAHPEDWSPAMGISTTSHDRRLAICDADGMLALGRAEGSSYPGWHGAFTRKVYLEYATWLLSHAFRPAGEAARAADERGRVAMTPEGHPAIETARQILTWWAPDEKEISHTLTMAAVQVAAGTDDAEIRDLWRKIREKLHRQTESAPGGNPVGTEMNALEAEVRSAKSRIFERRAPSEVPALEERLTAAEEKHADVMFRHGGNEAINHLRNAVDVALAKPSPDTEPAMTKRNNAIRREPGRNLPSVRPSGSRKPRQ